MIFHILTSLSFYWNSSLSGGSGLAAVPKKADFHVRAWKGTCPKSSSPYEYERACPIYSSLWPFWPEKCFTWVGENLLLSAFRDDPIKSGQSFSKSLHKIALYYKIFIRLITTNLTNIFNGQRSKWCNKRFILSSHGGISFETLVKKIL